METFLSPVEHPGGLVMKLVYYFTKKQLGKVITSIKVHSARLPVAFGMFYGKLPSLDKKLRLHKDMALLIRQKVAQLNICEFCIDAGRAHAMRQSMNMEKVNELARFNDSPLFTAAEKSALNYVTELTVNKSIKPETFKKMAAYFSEREICEIVYLVASEHLYNLTNIGLNIHSDMLCELVQSAGLLTDNNFKSGQRK